MRTPLSLILTHLQSEPSRTWSIVLTFFGDAVVPRGGSIWLAPILELFEGMAIGPGVVRTAMSRLASDGWLDRTRIGRNSYYRLSERGVTTFSQAEPQIYMSSYRDRACRLWFAMPRDLPEGEGFRAIMTKEGFTRLAQNTWIGAGRDIRAGIDAEAVIMEVRAPPEALCFLVSRAWPLERIAATYERYLDLFTPLGRWCLDGNALDSREALIARTLLIHEFRRVILRDPLLPAELMPESWPGHAALVLCAQIYQALLPRSEQWLNENAFDEKGPLPGPAEWLFQRFAPTHPAPLRHVTDFC